MTTRPYAATIAAVRGSILRSFAGLDAWFDESPEVLGFRPRDDAWTGAEILEHVTLTNHFLMLVIRKSTEKALKRAGRGVTVAAEGESDLGRLEPIGQRGSFAWKRPGHMIPTGSKSMAEVRELMRSQRDECLAFLDRLGSGEGSLCLVRMSVNGSGHLDIYQWLYFLAQHAIRHLAQLAANEETRGHDDGEPNIRP